GDRGSQEFPGSGVLDFAAAYNIPVFRSVKPYVHFDVYNLFNNEKLIGFNTTVRQDPASPKDALGLATGYIKSANFGKAQNNNNFPLPYSGLTGGRTFQMALGLRF